MPGVFPYIARAPGSVVIVGSVLFEPGRLRGSPLRGHGGDGPVLVGVRDHPKLLGARDGFRGARVAVVHGVPVLGQVSILDENLAALLYRVAKPLRDIYRRLRGCIATRRLVPSNRLRGFIGLLIPRAESLLRKHPGEPERLEEVLRRKMLGRAEGDRVAARLQILRNRLDRAAWDQDGCPIDELDLLAYRRRAVRDDIRAVAKLDRRSVSKCDRAGIVDDRARFFINQRNRSFIGECIERLIICLGQASWGRLCRG